MKHYFKKLTVFLYICIALIAYSCSEENDFVKGQNHGKIKIEEQSFEKLLQLTVFNDAYQRVVKTKVKIANSTMARTALEEQYGFDIVADAPIKVITDENKTSYIMLIERAIQENLKFENLLITIKGSEIGAYILKYGLTSEALKLAGINSYKMEITESSMIPLEVDGKTTTMDPCITTSVLMCTDTGGGQWSNDHPAEEACLHNGTNYLYVAVTTVCTEDGGGSGGWSSDGNNNGPPNNNPGHNNGIGSSGSGGNGFNEENYTPIPCFPCTEYHDEESDDDDCNTSKEKLALMFPNAPMSVLETLAQVINEKGKDFGIDTKEKLQHFLSQTGHECGGFTSINVTEGFYYTTTAQIVKTWPKRFSLTDINKLDPTGYINNSSLLANAVYHDRMGNEDISSGDGYKYRGRGIIQLTGKTGYTNFETFYNQTFSPPIDIVNTPNLVASDNSLSILSALWYFKVNVLDKLAIDENTTAKAVTYKINGGYNGLPDRIARFNNAVLNIDCLD